MAIWCENSSSVAVPLGDLADMFEYEKDGVVDVGVVISERVLIIRGNTRAILEVVIADTYTNYVT